MACLPPARLWAKTVLQPSAPLSPLQAVLLAQLRPPLMASNLQLQLRSYYVQDVQTYAHNIALLCLTCHAS